MDLLQLRMTRQQDLLREAESERLAAQLPRRRSTLRRSIASACERAAQWLDGGPNRYVQPSQTGLADWAPRSTNAYIWLADSVTPPAARDYKTRPTDQFLLR